MNHQVRERSPDAISKRFFLPILKANLLPKADDRNLAAVAPHPSASAGDCFPRWHFGLSICLQAAGLGNDYRGRSDC